MHFSCDLLDQSIERAGRLVALDLLEAGERARRRLDEPGDTEALHDFRVRVRRLRTWLRATRPWLGDSTPKRARRRLEKTARLTGVSRDAEVHYEWLEAQRHDLSSSQRPGHALLMRQIEREKHDGDQRVAAHATRAFDRARATLSRKLRSYRVDLEDSREEAQRSFAVEMAQLIRAHGVRLSHCLSQVQSFADAKEGHAARVAGKRLRYLIEVIAECVRGGEGLVAELSELQDLLGDWHDVEVFSATIAKASARKSTKRGRDTGPGLRALANRLENRGRTAFATIKSRWSDASAFQPNVEAIAQELAAYGGRPTEIERTRRPPPLRLITLGKLPQ